MTNQHYRSLESMYLAAPINSQIFKPTIVVGDKTATISINVREQLFHSAHAVHGSVYFKMLDDAAFFAANSIEPTVFVLTATFTTDLLKPVGSGLMRSVGEVVSYTDSKIIARASVYDDQDNLLGRGEGVFVRSKMPLAEADGYLADTAVT